MILENIRSVCFFLSYTFTYGGVVKSGVHACLSRRRSRVRIPSSPPYGQIAQSVEHLSEKQGVGSSILPLATINIGSNRVHNCTNQNSAQFSTHFVEHLE